MSKRDPETIREFLPEHDTVLAARVVREVRSKLSTGLKNPRKRQDAGVRIAEHELKLPLPDRTANHMDHDTDIGGPNGVFPATQYAVIQASSSPDVEERKQALEVLVTAYWKPIYKYIRIKKGEGNETAKDLTQAFFARALDKGFFQRYDPAKARFRTYLRVCVDGFLSNERKSASSSKRGGDREFLALDFERAEGELYSQQVSSRMDPEEFFHREWVRSLFSLAVDELRRQCAASNRSIHFALFERYDLEDPESAHKATYAELAQSFNLNVSQVTNYLASARREFRKLVLDRIRATTGSDEEFRAEAERLLGGNFS